MRPRWRVAAGLGCLAALILLISLVVAVQRYFTTHLEFELVSSPPGRVVELEGQRVSVTTPAKLVVPFADLRSADGDPDDDPVSGGNALCDVRIAWAGRTSSARIHCWDGGFKLGFHAIIMGLESMDGAAWFMHDSDYFTVHVRAPEPGRFFVVYQVGWQDRMNLTVDGEARPAATQGFEALAAGEHRIEASGWLAELAVDEGFCIHLSETGEPELGSLGLSYDPAQFSAATVSIDGAEVAPLADFGARPVLGARDCRVQLRDVDGKRCTLRMRSREGCPFVAVRITRG